MRRLLIVGYIAITAVLCIISGACSSKSIHQVTTADVATRLVFSTQPGQTVAGSDLSPQPTVLVKDAQGNTVTSFANPVTLSILTGSANDVVTLNGGILVTPVNGIVVFKGVVVNTSGTGYRLTATSGDLPPATSDPFDVIPAEASKIVFTSQPSDVIAGSIFPITPTVEVQDHFGNLVSSSSVAVTVSLEIDSHVDVNSGNNSISLSGTKTVNTVGGRADFTNLSINLSGSIYRLRVTSSGLESDTSKSFDVMPGIPVKLAFGMLPNEAVANSILQPNTTVWVVDTNGNICDASNPPVSITLSIKPGTGTSGATLSGTTTVSALLDGYNKGVAVFKDLSINLPGSGYRLTATGDGLVSATSDAFDVAVSSGAGK